MNNKFSINSLNIFNNSAYSSNAESQFIQPNTIDPIVITEEIPSSFAIADNEPIVESQQVTELENTSKATYNNFQNYCFAKEKLYEPNPAIVKNFLADHVGGDFGGHLKESVGFFTHYLTLYCESFPQDEVARENLAFLQKFVDLPLESTLQENVNTLMEKLESQKYVACEGGFFDDGSNAGHAILYEFFLDADQNVVFKLTNSGDGLNFHPLCNFFNGTADTGQQKEIFYRTLVFSGASLDTLKTSDFLSILLSFNRPRPKIEAAQNYLPNTEAEYSSDDLYATIFGCWPENGEVVGENPGGEQRGGSCFTQAIVKRIRDSYKEDRNQHAQMSLWIKCAVSSDYLKLESFSSELASDALRKMSTQASKLWRANVLDESVFSFLAEIQKRSTKAIAKKRTTEERVLSNKALTFPPAGIDLHCADQVVCHKKETIVTEVSQNSLSYNHCFPGEVLDYTSLPTLQQAHIASTYDEMYARLNFFRCLPDFEDFVYGHAAVNLDELQRKAFFADLANMSQKFFYTEDGFSTLHINDSFMADLLNGWMIVYLEAKREGQISPEVLLEWMNGLEVLFDSYTAEYRFDTPQARKRFLAVYKKCKTEIKALLEELGPGYVSPPNFWGIEDKKYWSIHTKQNNDWRPFSPPQDKISNWNELPAMARFSFKALQGSPQFPTGGDDYRTAIYLFKNRLENIWYYDALKESLAAFYVFADRHLSCKPDYNFSKPHEAITVVFPPEGHICNNLAMHPWFCTQNSRPGVGKNVHFFPEHHIPNAAKEVKNIQDLNTRIHHLLPPQDERLWPFFTQQEEREYLTFTFKDQKTRLPECLRFFGGRWEKLSDPNYQAAFDQALWGSDAIVESLFTDPSLSTAEEHKELLFDFIERGYNEALLLSSSKGQKGAAFLLHLHIRLCHLSEYSSSPDAEKKFTQLFENWEKLVLAAQNNPYLAKALGEAVIAAMPVIESSTFCKNNVLCTQLLANTILTECKETVIDISHYDQLSLHYGYRAFKALLCTFPKPESIWEKAVSEVFNEHDCTWIADNDIIKVGNKTIHLLSRNMENHDDTSAKAIPGQIKKSPAYKNLFKQKNIFAHMMREGDDEIYSFYHKSHSYQIRHNTISRKIQFFRIIEGTLYEYQQNPLNLSDRHFFVCNNHFWVHEKNHFVENKLTGALSAAGDEHGIHPIRKRKIDSEVLGYFSKEGAFVEEADPTVGPLIQAILRIEEPTQLNVWLSKKHKSIARIELPRLGLTLLPFQQSGKSLLICHEHPGFMLAQHQHVSFLKSFQSYIVLENDQGHRKVIVPLRELEKSKYEPYAQKTIRAKIDSDLLNKKTLVIDLLPNREYPSLELIREDAVTTTALMYLYLETKQYERVLELMIQTDLLKKRRLDSTSNHLLQCMLNTPPNGRISSEKVDQHPYAIALRMHFFSFWLHLHRSKRNPLGTMRRELQNTYDKYLNIYYHTGKFQLPQAQLKELSKFCEKKEACNKVLTDKRLPTGYSSSSECFWNLRNRILKGYGNALPPNSFTAPGEEFLFNFLEYYRILKTPSEDKQHVKRLLMACVSDEKAAFVAQVRTLLLWAIYDEKSPSQESMKELFSSGLNKEEFLKQMDAYLVKAKSCLNSRKMVLREFGAGTKKELCQWSSAESKILLPPTDREPESEFMPLPRITIKPLEASESIATLEKSCIKSTEKKNFDAEISASATIKTWAQTHVEKHTKENDLVVADAYKRIEVGVEKYLATITDEGKELSKTLSKAPKEISQTLSLYKKEIKKTDEKLAALEKAIVKAANDHKNHPESALEWMREIRNPLSIEILLIAMGRGDYAIIKNGNPQLTEADILQIMEDTGQYALLLSQSQLLHRCHNALNNYQSLLATPDEKAKEASAAQYLQHRLAKREYDPNQRPELLAFEALCSLLIRKEQLDGCDLLYGKELSWDLLEAKTGFGKSKILIPLWLLLTATPDVLSMMVVPSNLFDQQQTYLQQVLYNAYKFFGVRIDFARDSEAAADDIKAIHKTLREAQKMRRPIFMSDQTAHNLLVLKPKEMADKAASGSHQDSFKELLALKKFTKTSAHLFIDEPHKVLDDSQESNYSLGMPKSFEKRRLEFALQIYTACFALIKGRYRLECWEDEETKDLPLLTKEEYEIGLQRELLALLIENIQLSTTEDKYLQGEMSREEQTLFEQELKIYADVEHAEKIRILHDQLYHYLPQTIQQNAHEHYACIDTEFNRTALPLENARNAKKGHEYCSPDQILNFTIQANLATPFSQEHINAYVEELIQSAVDEADQSQTEIVQTLAYRKYRVLVQGMEESQKPKNLLKMTEEEKNRIHHYVEKNLSGRLQFIALSVLPKLQRYDGKITSTPHILVDCFQKVVGASGTLSKKNLPAIFRIAEDEMAIAKMLVILQKGYMEAGNPPVGEFSASDSETIINEVSSIASQSGLKNPSVIIEIGASLRDYTSLKHAAKDLLKAMPDFDGVATFDELGKPIVLIRHGKHFVAKALSGVHEDRLVWLFAQKDITGTDVILPSQAQALVLVNEHTTLTNLVQGLGRLRGFYNGQQARLCIEPNAAGIIKNALEKKAEDKLTCLEILTYFACREGELNGQANFRSLGLQWDAILENIFWNDALNRDHESEDVDEVVRNFKALKSLLIQETLDEPLKRPGVGLEAVEISDALALTKEQQIAKIHRLKNDLEKIRSPLSEKISEDGIMPKMKAIEENMPYPKAVALNDEAHATQTSEAASDAVNLSAADAKAASQMVLNMQQEQAQNAENTVEIDVESINLAAQLWSTEISRTLSGKEPAPHGPIEIHPLKETFEHKHLAPYGQLFLNSPLAVTKNACVTFAEDSVERSGWVNGYVKPLHYLWIVFENKKIKQCALCDESEAAELMHKKEKGLLWLVDNGVLASDLLLKTDALLCDPAFPLLEVQAKALNGDLVFSECQWTVFMNWIDTKEKAKLFMEFAEKVLFPLHPTLRTSGQYARLASYQASFDV